MGNQQRSEAHGKVGGQLENAQGVEPRGKMPPAVEKRHEQQTHGNAGDNIRIHHGNVVDGHQRIPDFAAHGIEADGGKSTGDGGDHRCQQGHQQGGVDALHDEPVAEELGIPVQREALPDHVAVACVEGKDDQQDDGGVEKHEHQHHKQAVEKRIVLFHIITACSSPSPKRFMITMQTTTITIITREMAAPR